MRVETIVNPDGSTRKHYIGDEGEHLFIPGPVTGIMELADGTKINVNPEVVVVADQAQAVELNDLIIDHWVENGHPADIDMLTDPDTGAVVPVQRPFVGEKSDGVVTGVGTPVGEHPLDYQLGEHTDEEAAAGAAAFREAKGIADQSAADSTTTKEG